MSNTNNICGIYLIENIINGHKYVGQSKNIGKRWKTHLNRYNSNNKEYNKVLYTIFTQGFTPFLKFLHNNNIEYPLKLTSTCELCEFLFCDDWFLKLLKEKNYFENI